MTAAPVCSPAARSPARPRRRPEGQYRLTLIAWLVYLLIVVYGSLVPLDFKPMALDQAWKHFQQIPMFEYTVHTRTDWMVNIALGVPTGFLTTFALIGWLPRLPRPLVALLANLFAIAFVASVEFSQLFFPPRLASINDIAAQGIGSVLGSVLAARFSNWFGTLQRSLMLDHRQRHLRLLEVYMVGYVALSLFPYDILLSASEIHQKLGGTSWGWWLAGADGHSLMVAIVRLLAEIALTIPFGLFLGYRPGFRPATWRRAIALGLLLGFVIEIAQFFTATGISQGLSVLARAAGVCCGLAFWRHSDACSIERLKTLLSRHATPFGALYLAALSLTNGWLANDWQGSGAAFARLGEVHFLPLYYHYYVPEARALQSISVTCLSYLPIGLLVWSTRGSARLAFVLALLAAGLNEFAKLFVAGMHPDPTNLWLGALSAWGMVHLARVLEMPVAAPGFAARAQSLALPHAAKQTADQQLARPWRAYALLPLLAFCAYWAATFPVHAASLCALLICCATVVWFRPVRLIAIAAAALPILDLAHWSGRFFFDEFDLLLIVVIAVGHARLAPVPRCRTRRLQLFTLAYGMLVASFAISTLRGLTPWPALDANAFNNYLSAFNGLRIAKGVLWGVLILNLMRRLVATGADVHKPLAWGLVSGLAATVAVILWERVAFSGLMNLASDYRVTGPFSAMHTGGAYVECFLASATPFVVALVVQSRNWGVKLIGALLLLVTTYALMVTFSRNGYFAFGVALAVVLFFTVFRSTAIGRHGGHAVFAALVSIALLAVALPVFTGQYAQSRLATLSTDFAIRRAHWNEALEMRTSGWATMLFGMGVGTYPRSLYLISSEGNRAASYQLNDENANRFLRLLPGRSIYMGQRVTLDRRQSYRLRLDIRANKPHATLSVSICEKWLLNSFKCNGNNFDTGESVGEWRHFEQTIDASVFRDAPWYSRRPLKLAFHNSHASAIIDVDNVGLVTISGDEQIRNGDFSEGLDHWFFTEDSHLPWHIHSLPVAVLFDQGWCGAIAVGLFTLCAIVRGGRRAWRGDLPAAAALAGLAAFLVVGLFDTLIDAPRFLFLLILLGGICGSKGPVHIKER